MRIMRAYGWVFLATGVVFVAAAVPLTELLRLPNGGMGLWLGPAGSLMAVISLLSFQIAEDPFLDSRWNLLLYSIDVFEAFFITYAIHKLEANKIQHVYEFLTGVRRD